MKKFLHNPLWAVVWGLFIIILHILPGSVFPKIPTLFDLLEPDKIVHIGMFSVLVFLLLPVFNNEGIPALLRKYPVLFAFIIALSLGAILELTQNYFILNRTGSVYDWIADLAGCFVGWGAWYLFGRLGNKATGQQGTKAPGTGH